MGYQDVLDSLAFAKAHDAYFANEIRSARREAEIEDLANRIGDEVIAGNSERRECYAEEIVDNECWISLIRDLLDDVKNGTDPTNTIKRSVYCWALGVAEYEVERAEHD